MINNSETISMRYNISFDTESIVPADHLSYEALQKEMDQIGSSILCVIDHTGMHQETLLKVLGGGGSKKAIQLAKGRALLLPNMDEDSIAEIALRWERMVSEEVAMSRILNRIGLLSPSLEQVNIIPSEISEDKISAYISETFEELGKTNGWFIIDIKNRDSSTWKEGKDFLFQSEEERLNEENWDSAVDSVLTDIEKICLYDIPAGRDSLNIAILKKPSESAVCQHEIRYFGFDFSDKDTPLAIPEDKPLVHPLNKDRAKWILNSILDNVFIYEFGRRYLFKDEGGNLKSLKNRLVQKYSEIIIARMNSQE